MTSEGLPSGCRIKDALERALQRVKRILPFEWAVVWLGDGPASLLWASWVGDGSPKEIISLSLPDDMIRRVAGNREPLLISDAESEECKIETIRSLMAVPLAMCSGNGILALGSRQPAAFTEADLRMLMALGDQIALVVDEARECEALQQAAQQPMGVSAGAAMTPGSGGDWQGFSGADESRPEESLYRQLEETKRDLAAARDAQAEFVSSVSHELRIPMTAIKGYTDMLLAGMAGGLTERQQRFLAVIKSNADRLGILVNDLLEISRLEAGRIRLECEAVPVGEVIAEAVKGLQGQLAGKKLELTVAVPEGLPPIWGDRSRLIQILTNLLSNAYKYTPEGGQICISAALRPATDLLDKKAPQPACVEVVVADTGIGIAPEEQSKVFQRFFRADHPMVRDQIGTGLGLSIVKGLVGLHGGRIWFESTQGKGTTFSFTIPIIPGRKQDTEAD